MVICMILATAGFVFFFLLFFTADENITGAMLAACRETELDKIKQGKIALNMIVEDMKRAGDVNIQEECPKNKK